MTRARQSLAITLLAALSISPQMGHAHPDTAHFSDTAFVSEPKIVECTLTDGTENDCYEITVGYLPEGLEIGPFCPATLEDAGGLWDWTGEDAGVYRIDGDFLRFLNELGYAFYDADGNVHFTDLTDRPDVENSCIAVVPDEDVEMTVLLPVTPVMAETPTDLGTVSQAGIALNGAPIFADAPSVQDTGNLPALDLCGGHIDPGGWYHWHATATDIQGLLDAEGIEATCGLAQDPTALFGYAFDGFGMYGTQDPDGAVPTDLDACNGHVGPVPGSDEEVYHYHATNTFPNLPACLVGLSPENAFATTASAGLGSQSRDGSIQGPGGSGKGTPPGFDEAAEALGVTTEALLEAMRSSGGGRPDLDAAAETLGVSEADLREALPPPPNQ
ncbi:MAG: YHYH protein [Pseudomonadota bacterium]